MYAEIGSIYLPTVGKNLRAIRDKELLENGVWEESVTVRVRGHIITWKPKGGVKHVRKAS